MFNLVGLLRDCTFMRVTFERLGFKINNKNQLIVNFYTNIAL